MSLLKKNIFANFLGSAWTSLLSLIFVPIYIHFLGIESYALIGLSATLQGMFTFLDMGITPTINREMARLSVDPNGKQEMRDLIRTIELFYWLVAILIGALVFIFAPFIAHSWLKTANLESDYVSKAFQILSLSILFWWPLSFYTGALLGMQRQVFFNKISMLISTISKISSVIVLWLFSPTIIAFFVWQIVTSAAETFTLVWAVWKFIPQTSKKSRINIKLVKGIWKFAAGSGGAAFIGALLSQLDRIILSKILNLEMLGYYNLASSLSTRMRSIFGPVTAAIYPKFTELFTQKNYAILKSLYHRSCQLMSILIVPVAAILSIFSYEVMLLWTQNPNIAKNTYAVVTILIIGKAINGFMQLPYMMQLAHGWSALGFYINLVSIIVIAPLIIIMSNMYGMSGAALVWLILNFCYVTIGIPLMHTRILTTEKWKWYLIDVFIPAFAGFSSVFLWKLTFNNFVSRWLLFVNLAGAGLFTLVITSLSTPLGRAWIKNKLSVSSVISYLKLYDK